MLDFFGVQEVAKSIQTQMKTLKLGLYMIMTSYSDVNSGQFRKEVLMFHDQDILSDEINKFHELKDMLSNDKVYQLKNMVDLSQYLDEEGDTQMVRWDVGNLKMSRKDMEKMLKVFYPFKIYSNFIQDGFSLDTMEWYKDPSSWVIPFGSEPEVEGYGGSWDIFDDG
jgi:hypothetical protein